MKSWIRNEVYFAETKLNTTRRLVNDELLTVKNVTEASFYARTFGDEIPRTSELRVVAKEGDWLLLYYCGEIQDRQYEGFLVYAKTPELNWFQKRAVRKAVDSATSFKSSDMCWPHTLGCIDDYAPGAMRH
jgi:hypothetical protein